MTVGKRKREPEQLGRILDRVLKERGLLDLDRFREIGRIWKEAAGESLAGKTRVGAFRNGVLTIEVLSAPLRQELERFRKEELLRAIRAFSPKEFVQDLRFRLV